MTDPAEPAPYWSDPDGTVTLYHGDMRDVLPALGLHADLVAAAPSSGGPS